jgi:general secretion pathway protein H
MKRGMTLIEMTVSLAIVAVLFAAVVIGVGALTGAKAKDSAVELAGVIKTLYDTANLGGTTCRLVFDLPEGKDDEGAVTYRAECAKSGIAVSKNRDEELKEAGSANKRKRKDKLDPNDKRFSRLNSDSAPSLQELQEREKQRVEEVAKFSAYTGEAIPEKTLSKSVRIEVWTRHQRDKVKSGPAYLYFFPQGYTERAHVYLKQGSNTWTLTLQPLTGKVAVVPEELEVPKS